MLPQTRNRYLGTLLVIVGMSVIVALLVFPWRGSRRDSPEGEHISQPQHKEAVPPGKAVAKEEKAPMEEPRAEPVTAPKNVQPETQEQQEDEKVMWGYLFVGGRYVAPPYKVEVKDLSILINGQIVLVFSPLAQSETIGESNQETDPDDLTPEEKRLLENIDPEEKRLRANIDEIVTDIGDHVFLWADLYTLDEAKDKLEQLLEKEKEKGRIAGFQISKGPYIAVKFLRPDGTRLTGVGFLDGLFGKRIGPPYDSYELGTKEFDAKLLEIATSAVRRGYDDETTKTIVTNFLKSQPSVQASTFENGQVAIKGRDGRELKIDIPRPIKGDEQAERLSALRKNIESRARAFSETLSGGGFVAVASTSDGYQVIPQPDTEKVVRGIWSAVEPTTRNVTDKLNSLPTEIQVPFSEEIAKNFAEYDALGKRLGMR